MTAPAARRARPKAPHLRRLDNLAAFWRQRYAEAGDDHGMLAGFAFDRAKAAARRAVRDGHPLAMYELAQLLHEWSERAENAEAERAKRDAP